MRWSLDFILGSSICASSASPSAAQALGAGARRFFFSLMRRHWPTTALLALFYVFHHEFVKSWEAGERQRASARLERALTTSCVTLYFQSHLWSRPTTPSRLLPRPARPTLPCWWIHQLCLHPACPTPLCSTHNTLPDKQPNVCCTMPWLLYSARPAPLWPGRPKLASYGLDYRQLSLRHG